jgi:uncharacterized membrane protein
MTPEQLERLWQDPRCWSPIGIYRCPLDPRIVVPKRIRWAGWTLNFAHRAAWPVLLGLVVLAVALIVALSAWEASRPRG